MVARKGQDVLVRALPAIRRGDLVPLLSEYQAKDDTAIHVVYLPERQLVPRIRAFMDFVAAHIQARRRELGG